MRLLITASRTWEGFWGLTRIHGVLVAFQHLSAVLDEQLTVVHGDCPTGGDQIADRWCLRRNVPVERHPADWTKYGKSAGPLRNEHMVRQQINFCVGFRRDHSTGTGHTLSLAREAGIPTWEIPWDPERDHYVA